MIITGKKFSKPEMSRVINGDIKMPDAPEKSDKVRLDILMTEIFTSYNRSTLQKFIENGYVFVGGDLAKKPNQKFERGTRIELNLPEELRNADVKLEVIYEDDDVLVVNKPCGMLSEPRGEFCPEKTLADYGFIAHRLDRDTSGVVIIAKTEEVQLQLKKQFKARQVHKTYAAVVLGQPKLDKAKLDLPLLRNLKRPTTFLINPNGKPAQTYYEVLKTNGKLSLVELKPITGRTHQLRVHMNYIGHPILGDRVYGDTEKNHFYFKTLTPRMYLHAEKLEIILPSGVKKTFIAPLPQEFKDVF